MLHCNKPLHVFEKDNTNTRYRDALLEPFHGCSWSSFRFSGCKRAQYRTCVVDYFVKDEDILD